LEIRVSALDNRVNEYLVARHHGRTVTIVPDLIAILDAESAEPLTAEMLAYGQRVRVIGYSAAPSAQRLAPSLLAHKAE
jgi:hypothetical protein